MSRTAFLPAYGFGSASRLRTRVNSSDELTLAELTILIGAGVLAASAIAFLQMPLRIPGNVILKATLPIVLGVAIVPRRLSGTICGLAAAVTVGAFLALGVGRLQPAAIASLFAIGPAIDFALRGASGGGRSLYLRFAVAGLAANLLSFAVRWLISWSRLDASQPHVLPRIDTNVLISFAACGYLAGVVCAAICFRSSNSSE